MNKLEMYKALSKEDKDNLSIYNIFNSIFCIARNNNYEITNEEVERLEEVAYHLYLKDEYYNLSESRIADFISECYIEHNISLDELIFGKSKLDNGEINDYYKEDLYAINEISKLLKNYKKRLKYRFSPDEDTQIYLVKCKMCNKTIMVHAYEPLTHIDECPKCKNKQQQELTDESSNLY